MTTLQKIIGVVALLLIVALGVTVWGGGHKYGGVVYEESWFNGPANFAATVNEVISGVKTALINTSGQWVYGINTSQSVTLTGSSRVKQPVETGAKLVIGGSTTSTSITAAQICANDYVEWPVTGGSATATLPTAADFAANCLTTTGDRLPYIVWKNTGSGGNNTSFTAGASTTAVYVNASTTGNGVQSIIGSGAYASLRFLVTSSSDPTSAVTVLISQFK